MFQLRVCSPGGCGGSSHSSHREHGGVGGASRSLVPSTWPHSPAAAGEHSHFHFSMCRLSLVTRHRKFIIMDTLTFAHENIPICISVIVSDRRLVFCSLPYFSPNLSKRNRPYWLDDVGSNSLGRTVSCEPQVWCVAAACDSRRLQTSHLDCHGLQMMLAMSWFDTDHKHFESTKVFVFLDSAVILT